MFTFTFETWKYNCDVFIFQRKYNIDKMCIIFRN